MADRKKIVMVGPVYPYKGGISHYTGLMCKNLRKKFDVAMVSYKMQYPKILFRKEQRDYENDTFKVENTNFEINTANIFSWGHSAKVINDEHPDLVIFQWWHPYFSPCYSSIIKKIKAKVLFLCHNVFPHERFPMDRKLAKSVLKKGDLFIVHSTQDAKDLLTIVENAVFEKAVHPTYNAFKFEDMSKEKAREILEIEEDEKVLLFFGFIREYKGLKHILAAMPEIIAKIPKCKLYVVGEFGKAREEYDKIIAENTAKDNIVVYGDYVPDREIEKFFACCDVVVLPYESATQSGIVQIAYGFEKPVIATNVGGLPEVVIDGKTGYVVPPKDEKALAQAVIKYFEENKEEEFEQGVKAEAYKYSWDRMTETVERLMEK